MPHQSRKPPVQLIVDKKEFNKLLGILDFNIKLNIEKKNFSKNAGKLKEKIMTYTVPRINKDDNTELIDVRFFNSEASILIDQLLTRSPSYIEEENYYEVLLNKRSEKINN